MKRIITICVFIWLLATGTLFALSDTTSHDVTMQVNEIALIDLNNTAAITLTTNNPANGGDDPLGDTDSTKLLQYTSLAGAALSRNITAQWGATDTAPAGTSLKLQATSIPAGCGTAAAQVTLSNVGQNLITGIGSCATGTGASGAALTYTFSIDTVGSLVVGETQTVTVTFTLTDAA